MKLWPSWRSAFGERPDLSALYHNRLYLADSDEPRSRISST
jgi:hypothetical protein